MTTQTQLKPKTKPIWLDLELRKDVDDALALIFAIQSGLPLKAISIHNPSTNELRLLQGILKYMQTDVPVFFYGAITEYPSGEDIEPSLLPLMVNQAAPLYAVNFKDATPEFIAGEYTVFCGGSLATLATLALLNPSIDAVVQGGYASFEIVPPHAVLKKFNKRKAVPTWNLNLDMQASNVVINSGIPVRFVSKNICHSAHASSDDMQPGTFMQQVFSDYLARSDYPTKMLHDVLALMSITSPDIFTFAKVDLHHTDDERLKWWSTLNPNSHMEISIDYDNAAFLQKLRAA